MTKATPGPWTWGAGYNGLYGPNGSVILEYASYENMWLPDYMPGAEANARLIAAAPELLEALKAIVASDMAMREEDEGNVSPELNAARAAIAKATGGVND